jgi:hypothetical protein
MAEICSFSIIKKNFKVAAMSGATIPPTTSMFLANVGSARKGALSFKRHLFIREETLV